MGDGEMTGARGGTFGWPVRLLVLLLMLVFAALGGPNEWKMLLAPRNLIATGAVVVFFLGWIFLDRLFRRNKSN
jgi:hypothetical protein